MILKQYIISKITIFLNFRTEVFIHIYIYNELIEKVDNSTTCLKFKYLNSINRLG